MARKGWETSSISILICTVRGLFRVIVLEASNIVTLVKPTAGSSLPGTPEFPGRHSLYTFLLFSLLQRQRDTNTQSRLYGSSVSRRVHRVECIHGASSILQAFRFLKASIVFIHGVHSLLLVPGTVLWMNHRQRMLSSEESPKRQAIGASTESEENPDRLFS